MSKTRGASASTRLQVRVNERELDAWREAARANGLTLSEWVRRTASSRVLYTDLLQGREEREWQRAAAEEGMSLVDWVRRAAREWAARSVMVLALVLAAGCASSAPRDLELTDGGAGRSAADGGSVMEDASPVDAGPAPICPGGCEAPAVCRWVDVPVDGGAIRIGTRCELDDGGAM